MENEQKIQELAMEYNDNVTYFNQYYDNFIETFDPQPVEIWAILKMLELNERKKAAEEAIEKSGISIALIMCEVSRMEKENGHHE